MTTADNIFDAANAMGDRIQRRIYVQNIEKQLTNMRTTCGSCRFFMCGSDCPAEWNDRGRPRGPSATSKACGKFQMNDSDKAQEKKAIEEIARLTALGI